MLTVISPAKTLDFESELPTDTYTQPKFKKQSAELIDLLRGFKPDALSDLMHISEKLAHLNVDRYEAWQTRHTTGNSRQAIFAFKGDVYLGLEAHKFSQTDCEFAQGHLRILSGLYGVLRPLDLMQAYRLEMGSKLSNIKGDNLYDFWGNQVTTTLNRQAKSNDDPAILNLASNEYFKVIKKDELKVPVVSPVFKDEKNGKFKIISFFAKKARGMMSGWVIQNQITEPTELKKFKVGGYLYSAKDSTDEKPVFLRKEGVTK